MCVIQIGGPDKHGKQTQSEWLAKHLALDGYQVSLIAFPDYSTKTGVLIEDMLHGRLPFTPGDNPTLAQSLYTINRYEAQYRMERALQDSKIVICDRYIESSMAYGMFDGLDPDWVASISHSLIQPDITVILEISDEEYLRRCKNYEVLDYYESKLDTIQTVRRNYKLVAERFEGRIFQAEGEPEEIAREIYAYVKEKMEYGV